VLLVKAPHAAAVAPAQLAAHALAFAALDLAAPPFNASPPESYFFADFGSSAV
jgi:hypothetical protein